MAAGSGVAGDGLDIEAGLDDIGEEFQLVLEHNHARPVTTVVPSRARGR